MLNNLIIFYIALSIENLFFYRIPLSVSVSFGYSGAIPASRTREFSYIWLPATVCDFSFLSDSRISFAFGKKSAVMKILIVEDEPSLREIMVQTLRREQYVVEQAADYASALDKIAGYDYDCILLDIMLPDGSGLQLLEELKRQRRQAGIIIISARDSLDDKIEGLELGADDYLPKPFHLAELSARIRSVVRRHQRGGQESLDAGNVRLFPDSRRVEIAGREVELLRKEYDILYYFMSRPNHMIDKTTLAEAVWGDHIDQADNFDFVYAQMKNLRRRLHDAQADIEIRAVYGFGYKLVIP